MGSKRTADRGQVRGSRKRQKTVQNLSTGLEPQAEQKQLENEHEDQVVRFMDLAGELRNRIYEYATEYAHRCFPPIFPKEKPTFRRGRSSGPPSLGNELAKTPPLPLPYMSLTHTCSIIRSEFRPAWLSTNKVPLCALDGYLRVFSPRPTLGAPSEAQRRLHNQYDPSGSLRIWIRKNEMDDVDITRLLKHIDRFPNYTITIHSQPDVHDTLLTSLELLVANKNATWIKWIKNNTISQVRLVMRGFTGPNRQVRVVVREPYAMQWMKSTLPMAAAAAHSDPYAETLGLVEVRKVWRITFGVDYS